MGRVWGKDMKLLCPPSPGLPPSRHLHMVTKLEALQIQYSRVFIRLHYMGNLIKSLAIGDCFNLHPSPLLGDQGDET